MFPIRNRLARLTERHVEKALLVAAVLFAACVAYAYVGRAPNRRQFEGRWLGASQLNGEILASARRLEAAVRSAAPADPRCEPFSQELRRRFAAGVFDAAAADTPPLQPALPAVAEWGRPLPAAGSDDVRPAHRIALAEPLPPDQPAARTGRSMIRREEAAPVETAWVSLAAPFSVARQRAELERAGYAAQRTAVCVVDVELQRQELLAGGGWSEWTSLPSAAALQQRLPEARFDDASGALLNREALDEALTVLRRDQNALMQPAFPAVEKGDVWMPPALDGLPPEPVAAPGPTIDANSCQRPGPTPPSAGPHGPRNPPQPAAPPDPPSTNASADGEGAGAPLNGESGRPTSARRQAANDLRQAGQAIRQRDLVAARAALRRIFDNAVAPDTLKAEARRLAARIDRDAAAAAIQRPDLVTTRDGDPVLWRHDLSVEGGRTYRYRMRVWLWNPYVGRSNALTDASEARHSATPGRWSAPSEPVTAAPRTRFFVSGPAADRPAAASVEVWRWLDGEWLRQRFEVTAGDEIGGVRRVGRAGEAGGGAPAVVDFSTGAVVTDIRSEPLRVRVPGRGGGFALRPAESLVLAYLDPVDGQVKERAAEIDRGDPVRARLREDELP